MNIPVTAPADGQTTEECATWEITCYNPCPETADIRACFTVTGDASACEPDCSEEEQALQDAQAALDAADQKVDEEAANFLQATAARDAAQEAVHVAELTLQLVRMKMEAHQEKQPHDMLWQLEWDSLLIAELRAQNDLTDAQQILEGYQLLFDIALTRYNDALQEFVAALQERDARQAALDACRGGQ